jgi:hypothetical protein
MPLAGYSGTPLVKKLGIKPDSRLVILRAPDGFRDELRGLPDGVAISTRASGVPELTIWFVTRRKELEGDIARVSVAMGQGLWIAWPKKSSALAVDVTEDVVRNAGLAHGLVDYKVCAINETWSGLKFARRKKA